MIARILPFRVKVLLGWLLLASALAADPSPDADRGHLARLSVSGWHDAGVQGQGMTIAVLDSGFRGYREHLGKALPATVVTRSFRTDGNLEARASQHGILCGEILHTLVPRAKLLLANWEPDSPQSFIDAVRWAKSQGARIVSCSVIMPGWSDGNGGGPVHEALASLLGPASAPNSVLFFACAGNTALRHWTGPFCADERGRHQWRARQVSNRLVPWGTEHVTVELYGALNENYTLHLLEDETGRVIGQASTRDEDAFGPALLRFRPRPTDSYRVVVTRDGATKQPAEKFHLVVLGGSLEHAVPVASIPFPGDGARVVTVGAVDRDGNRVAYSSCGSHSGVRKPDLVAPVPFPSRCREVPFAGTSAAAPQAAGLAALLWSRYPNATAEQIHRQLQDAARDLGPKGHDLETGHGQVRMPPR